MRNNGRAEATPDGGPWALFPKPEEFEVYDGKTLCAIPFEARKYVVDGLLPEYSMSILAGEEGCGKSLIAMNLAVSVAMGLPSWLSYRVAQQGKVLYLNNELYYTDFAFRLKRMTEAFPDREGLSNLIVPKEFPSLKSSLQNIVDLCLEHWPKLVIVDCLYMAHNQDENDSSAMRSVMREIKQLRDNFHMAILVIHHTKKGAQYKKLHNDEMRGSNVFGAMTDAVLMMRRSAKNEALRVLKPTKLRHSGDGERKTRLLSLDQDSLWFKDLGETDEAQHTAQAPAREGLDLRRVLAPGKEYSRAEIVEATRNQGLTERTVDRSIQQAVTTGVLKKAKYGHYEL